MKSMVSTDTCGSNPVMMIVIHDGLSADEIVVILFVAFVCTR